MADTQAGSKGRQALQQPKGARGTTSRRFMGDAMHGSLHLLCRHSSKRVQHKLERATEERAQCRTHQCGAKSSATNEVDDRALWDGVADWTHQIPMSSVAGATCVALQDRSCSGREAARTGCVQRSMARFAGKRLPNPHLKYSNPSDRTTRMLPCAFHARLPIRATRVKNSCGFEGLHGWAHVGC